ncbi:unnamed protein product [Prunus armeniaca]
MRKTLGKAWGTGVVLAEGSPMLNLGINRSPPSSHLRSLGWGLDTLFNNQNVVQPFGGSADGGAWSLSFCVFSFGSTHLGTQGSQLRGLPFGR